jgi:hypothetical protein
MERPMTEIITLELRLPAARLGFQADHTLTAVKDCRDYVECKPEKRRNPVLMLQSPSPAPPPRSPSRQPALEV